MAAWWAWWLRVYGQGGGRAYGGYGRDRGGFGGGSGGGSGGGFGGGSAAASAAADPWPAVKSGRVILIIAGPSGSGKTTIGILLAGRLHWSFTDADSFHPAASIEKMRRGEPLTDAASLAMAARDRCLGRQTDRGG